MSDNAEFVYVEDDEFGIVMDPCEHPSKSGQADGSWRCDACGAVDGCDRLVPTDNPSVMTNCPQPAVWDHPNGVLRYCADHRSTDA